MSMRTLHRVTADSAMQSERRTVPMHSLQALNQSGVAAQPDRGQASTGCGLLDARILPPNSVMILTASMKRRMRDSGRPGVPTGTTVCARALFNQLYQEKMGRDSDSMKDGFPIYTTITNSIKDDIRSFLYHRIGIERGARTYSSLKKDFPSQIMQLKKRLLKTYPVLCAAQGGWVLNELLKESIQRDKKAAAEARKRENKKRTEAFPNEGPEPSADEHEHVHASAGDNHGIPGGGNIDSRDAARSTRASIDHHGAAKERTHEHVQRSGHVAQANMPQSLEVDDEDIYRSETGDGDQDISQERELGQDARAIDEGDGANLQSAYSAESDVVHKTAPHHHQLNRKNDCPEAPVRRKFHSNGVKEKSSACKSTRVEIYDAGITSVNQHRVRPMVGRKVPRTACKRRLVGGSRTHDEHETPESIPKQLRHKSVPIRNGKNLLVSRKRQRKKPKKSAPAAGVPEGDCDQAVVLLYDFNPTDYRGMHPDLRFIYDTQNATQFDLFQFSSCVIKQIGQFLLLISIKVHIKVFLSVVIP